MLSNYTLPSEELIQSARPDWNSNHVGAMTEKTIDDDELEAVYQIAMGTADTTGERFFKEVVRRLASVLDVRYAFLSVFTTDDTKLRVLAFWDATQFRDIGEYDLAPTPCSRVVTGNVYHCQRDVQKRFPNDKDLAALGAESYRGVPLIGPTGRHTGHLAAVDTRPLEEKPRFIKTMQIFATRAAAEMERVQAETGLADSLEELRRAQASLIASKRAASQGRLAAALSHELNNAVSVLTVNSDLFDRYLAGLGQQGEDPEAVQRLVSRATDTARGSRLALKRISELVNRLNRFTNLDRAEHRSVDITCLLEDTIGVLSGAWAVGIRVLRDYAEDLPPVRADPRGLSEVFANILNNSASALDGPGEIRVTTRYSKEYMNIQISDTGPGIESERLSHIFEPGFRVKEGRVTTGWGLFISRQIIHEHDGELFLNSKPEEGTQVEIRLRTGEAALRNQGPAGTCHDEELRRWANRDEKKRITGELL